MTQNAPKNPNGLNEKGWRQIVTPGRIGFLAVVGVVLLASFSFTVIESGQVGVVTRSGAAARLLPEPGLYAHWPLLDRVTLIDLRLQTSEQATVQDYQTADKETLQLAGWLAWRVVDPLLFQQTAAANISKASSTDGDEAVETDQVLAGRIIELLSETLAAQVAKQPAKALQNGLPEAVNAAWLAALNEALKPLGVTVERVALRQSSLTATATEAIYKRMSTAQTASKKALIDGLAADEKALSELQNRQREQVLDAAYRKAQQIRQQADKAALATLARQYGDVSGFAKTLNNPPAANALVTIAPSATKLPADAPSKPAPTTPAASTPASVSNPAAANAASTTPPKAAAKPAL